MIPAELIKFANDNRVCSIATVDGNQPRVRLFGMWFADETGFYFSTETSKPVYRQLKVNPRTEVCFYSPGKAATDIGKMMRVAGEVEWMEDLELKTKLLNDLPFLKDMGITTPDNPLLAVFRIAHGEAIFWTMEGNLKEPEKIRF